MSEPALDLGTVDRAIKTAKSLKMGTIQCGHCRCSLYALYADSETAEKMGLKPEQIDTCPMCGEPPFDPPAELAGMRAYFVDPYIRRDPPVVYRQKPERAFWRGAYRR